MRTITFPATHDDSWNKKKKKNPAAKTSVDINPDCHIFLLEQQNTRQQPQSTTNEMVSIQRIKSQ